MTDSEFRIEHDSMGEVAVPAAALWGAQTQRAVQNFPVSGERLHPALIRALASIKAEAALVNIELGGLAPELGQAIHDAAAQVAAGLYLDQFPLDVFQTGSGTSSNMNANEVIATLASRELGRPVHPNDHVNASQSSNDVFPSAIHLAAARLLVTVLEPALAGLAAALEGKAAQFTDVVKAGRHGIARIRAVLPEVTELPLGGTAVGTGLNAPAEFAGRVIAALAAADDLPLAEAADHFEAAGARDGLVAASGVLRTIAISLLKICTDLRLMNSGPRAGLAEISIPDLQPGSSIMPGKVNPVICEAASQVCAQVIGNDAAVAFGGSAGNFELNVMLPGIGRNLLRPITLLSSVPRLLADTCVAGITAHDDRLRRDAQSPPAIVTALNPYLGYEAAAAIAHQSLETGETIREVTIARGHVDRGEITLDQLDQALDVLSMAWPHGHPAAPK